MKRCKYGVRELYNGKYIKISRDIKRYQEISRDIKRYQEISRDIKRYEQIWTDRADR